MQETRIWSLAQEDPTCCQATKPMCHSSWAGSLESGSCYYWSSKLEKNMSYQNKNSRRILTTCNLLKKKKLSIFFSWASLVAQMVKNLPVMWETWVWSLGWEDPLEEDMATQFSILAWRIPIDRGAWQTTVHRVAKSWNQLSDYAHTFFSWLALFCHCLCSHDFKLWIVWGFKLLITLKYNWYYIQMYDIPLIIIRGKLSCFWRRQWHRTPTLLPGKSLGQRRLVGCSPWGH